MHFSQKVVGVTLIPYLKRYFGLEDDNTLKLSFSLNKQRTPLNNRIVMAARASSDQKLHFQVSHTWILKFYKM